MLFLFLKIKNFTKEDPWRSHILTIPVVLYVESSGRVRIVSRTAISRVIHNR